jgi:hypothetical protein
MNQFSYNPNAIVSQVKLGEEAHPLIVIDDFLTEPEGLSQQATCGEAFIASSTDYYPGHRKPIRGAYSSLLSEVIRQDFSQAFNLSSRHQADVGLCSFSIATTKPQNLRPIQSLPHFDNSDPYQLATVHYLCPAKQGGTSFYRHRKTGFESINPERVQPYAGTLKSEVVAAQFKGQQYMAGDNDWFEQIFTVDAKYNRLILFQGYLLHSGNISQSMALTSNPEKGRLTANSFVRFSV